MLPARVLPSYIPALTGLRAYAFGLVLLDHWLGGAFSSFLFGGAGVSVFFVLSGFLISRILLASRQRVALSGGGMKAYLLRFYYRRSVRIFPIYFLTLAALLLLGDSFVQAHSGWFFAYAANFLFLEFPAVFPIHLAHLWSLSSEEQLYLVLPLLIWYWPLKRVPLLAVLLVIIGVGFRAGCYWMGVAYPWEMGYTSALGCLDSYGIGLALAYYFSENSSAGSAARIAARRSFFRSGFGWFVLVTLWPLVILFAQLWTIMGHGIYSGWGLSVMSRLSVSLLGGYLIGYLLEPARAGADSWPLMRRWLLENRLVLYVGQISYGLYLVHNLIYHHLTPADYPTRQLWAYLVSYLPVAPHSGLGAVTEITFYGCLCLGLASLSWFLIEKPMLTHCRPSSRAARVKFVSSATFIRSE